MYSGAVSVKIRQAKRIAGAVNSKLPCFLYSKYAVPTLTKNRMARIMSTTGKTTLLTTSLTCSWADSHVFSMAPATSPVAKAVAVNSEPTSAGF